MSNEPTRALEEGRRRALADQGNRSAASDPVRTVDREPDALATVAATVHPGAVPHRAALAALQRTVGNAAVAALLEAKARPGGAEKVADLDAALREARTDQPQLDPVEKGLRVAKDVGVPVDIDGAEHKPPASALAVTRTGFGPSTVPAKKPVPPPKSTAAFSPMAKAARPIGKPKGTGSANQPGTADSASPAPAPAVNGTTAAGPANILAPPEPPTRLKPTDDPGFTAVTTAAGGYAKAKAAHPSAGSKAKEAQDAAVAPADDVDSQAKAAKVDTMDAQRPGSFDKKAFIEAVKAAIEAKSPKTLEEADKYKESGQAGQVKDQVKGLVGGNTQQSGQAIETATKAPPDASKAVAKGVTPLKAEDAGAPGTIPAAGAAPKQAPADQLNLEGGKHEADQTLADADVTEQQLATSNEPEFAGALAAKQQAAEHASTAPAQFREQEAATLAQSRAGAADATKATVDGIHGSKEAAVAQVTGSKGATKSADEAKRAEVSAKVQSIYGAAETDVKAILDGIDPKVDKAFEEGEKGARAQFEAFVAAKMSAYKKDRYGGLLGPVRWAKDKLFDMPPEVNEFYVAGRELYLKQMDRVISNVADIVGADLGAAKARIAKGKAEIAAYVSTLGPELKSIGADAAQRVGDQFAKLESDVAAKQGALVDSLASKYVEARQGLDDRITQLQEENKGLASKAIGALKGVIETILKLKDMLLNVLARAAAAVGKIIKDPIGFLGNFVGAVKTGIVNFGAHILDHFKQGLQKWLFGALAEGGIELPQKWDLKGVIQLVLSILGLTWQRVRGRIVAKIGEPAMSFVEKGFDVVKILLTEGLGGLWKWVLEKAGDLKEMVMEQVKEMVAVQIIKAGITWLISMLNPVGAFIKACKMIYDVVMFFVEKAAQIKEFVDAVLDSVESIAAGGVGAVASKIEDTLGKLVPILIGFLASLLGLGGIADKIKKILETIQKPVMKVVDWVVGKAVAFGKRFKGAADWAKGKVAKGKAWARAQRDRFRARRERRHQAHGGSQDRGAVERSQRVRAGVTHELKSRLAGLQTPEHIRSIATGVFTKWQPRGLRGLEVVSQGSTSDKFDVYVAASPLLMATEVKCDLSQARDKAAQQPSDTGHGFSTADLQAIHRGNATRANVTLSWPKALDTLGVLRSGTVRSGDRFWWPTPAGDLRLVPRRTLDAWLKAGNKTRNKSKKGVHAEVAAVQSVRDAWDGFPLAANFRANFGYSPKAWLRLNTTLSPCPPCAKAIVGLLQLARSRGWDLKVHVSAFVLFSPKKNPSVGREGLDELARGGVELTVLTLSSAERQSLLETNPKAAGTIGKRGVLLAEEVASAKARAEVHLGKAS